MRYWPFTTFPYLRNTRFNSNFLWREMATDISMELHKILRSLYFKLVAAIFFIFAFFTKWQSFKNDERYFLFHLKSSFPSRDNQIFVFPPSPIFFPVCHCLRARPKINLKDSDVISCLNNKFMTHFVWYLEKEKRYDIETLAIDTVLNKEHFYEKIVQKMCTKS